MSFENPLTFVRSLKGAPASVFLALLFARHPMTSRELQRWTGYSDKAISQAALLLVDLGWLSALGPHGPWTLGDGRQLPLIENLPAETSGPASVLVDDHPDASQPASDQEGAEEKEDPNFVKSLHALYDAGIHEPTAGRLARLPYVTPDYVTAHVEQANAQGFGLGTAIYRIEHAWPLPDKKAALTVEDRIRKFLEDR